MNFSFLNDSVTPYSQAALTGKCRENDNQIRNFCASYPNADCNLSLACNGPNREKAEENEAKARQETRTLANKAKTEAQDLRPQN